MYLNVCIFLCVISSVCVNPEKIPSTHYETIALYERKFIKKLQAAPLHSLCDEDSNLVQKYIADFEESSYKCRRCNSTDDVLEQVHWMVYNPLALYRHVHRLFHYFPRVRSIAMQWIPTDFTVTTFGLRYATDPIVYMVYVDNLNISALANGHLFNIDLGVRLNARHCHEIGEHAAKAAIFAVAIQFYELALSKAVIDGSISPYAVERSIQAAILQHDIFRRKSDHSSTFPGLFLFTKVVAPLRRKYGRQHYLSRCIAQKHMSSSEYTELDRVYNLCHRDPSGNLKKILNAIPDLRCWHEAKTDPYWTLHPLRVEELARNPDFIVIRNAIGPKRIEDLKKFSVRDEPLDAIHSPPYDLNQGWKPPDSVYFRIFPTDDTFPPELPHLRDAQMLSGFSVKNTKKYKQKYFFNMDISGGTYEAHIDNRYRIHDPIDYAKANVWDETVATMMIYLELPDIGGETMLVPGNATVSVEVGTAVLWYTLRKDGANAPALHGACTVLLGRKWTVNKQFEYCDQFGYHQCALNREELFSYPRSYLRRKR